MKTDDVDIELYMEFVNGNDEAFNKIIEKYRINLIAFIYKYVKNYEIAEDLSQDTFVYILVNRKEYDYNFSLKTYLYTIAKCRALNYLKKAKRIISFNEEYIQNINSDFSIDSNIIEIEKNKKVNKAISKLKAEYQAVIFLRDFEELKYEEICKVLNKSMPQLKSLIHRARKALKKMIEKEEKNVK